jgi:hypothetical protein
MAESMLTTPRGPGAPAYNRVVGLELIVDPSASGEPQRTLTVMLWTRDADPVLKDAKVFTSGADFRAWLKEVVFEHGSENISVRWTKRLLADKIASRLVAACLGIDVPEG